MYPSQVCNSPKSLFPLLKAACCFPLHAPQTLASRVHPCPGRRCIVPPPGWLGSPCGERHTPKTGAAGTTCSPLPSYRAQRYGMGCSGGCSCQALAVRPLHGLPRPGAGVVSPGLVGRNPSSCQRCQRLWQCSTSYYICGPTPVQILSVMFVTSLFRDACPIQCSNASTLTRLTWKKMLKSSIHQVLYNKSSV